MYLIVKHFHVTLAIISITLFQFRYWCYKVRNNQPNRLLRVLPHGIDTLLLLLGTVLAIMASFSPLNSPWLFYKLLALLAYIVFGMLAMKKSGNAQWLFYLAATLAVLYLVSVALTKSPWPL
jgi:uncharacterized membrane protein SirB2